MNITFNQTVTSPVGTVAIPTVSAAGDEIYEAVLAIAPAASNAQKNISIVQATMQFLLLLFTANVAPGATKQMTLKTNSSGSPQETITLTDGIPVVYYAGGPYANPFAGNVTTVFATDTTTNAVGGTLTVKALNNQ